MNKLHKALLKHKVNARQSDEEFLKETLDKKLHFLRNMSINHYRKLLSKNRPDMNDELFERMMLSKLKYEPSLDEPVEEIVEIPVPEPELELNPEPIIIKKAPVNESGS